MNQLVKIIVRVIVLMNAFLLGCQSPDTSSLEGRDHRPPDLVDLLAAPGALPVADPADTLAGGFVDDLELPGVGSLVARLAFGDLLRALRPAEVLHHLRIAKGLLEERKIPFAPRLDAHSGTTGDFAFLD